MKKYPLTLVFFFIISCVYSQDASISIKNGDPQQLISRHVYGHFSEHLGRCIYGGFWVDSNLNVPRQGRIRMDIVNALKKINIPNLRWPGGCFADEYHWRDGIGASKSRPKMVNTHWGGVTEDNSFGTHEFLELCSLLDCEPYIAGNVGSGTVDEMSKWIEYLNFEGESPMSSLRKQNGREKPWKVSFWGVGNESWGCGGNMTAEYYANEYKRYATFAKNYPGTPLKKIATGPNSADYNWTEVAMKNIGNKMWGLSLHHYTIPTSKWSNKGSATQFDEKEYFNTLKNCLLMEELITKHSAIMEKYDPKKQVALVVDEWGVWTAVEPGTNPGFLYQQNSMRDALVAASTLNIFNNHCDRVKMANLAQTVNVLQALILTDKQKMLLTPTYHVFDLYKVHQDAQYMPLNIASPDYVSGDQKIPAVNASASKDKNGNIHATLVNVDPSKKIVISLSLDNNKAIFKSGQILTSAKYTDINTFENPDHIQLADFKNVKKKGNEFKVELPPLAIVMLEIN